MELVLQTLIVAVLVVVSAAFATWRLTPARTRLRVLTALNPREGSWLARLRKSAADELSFGCSACASSGTHVKKHARH